MHYFNAEDFDTKTSKTTILLTPKEQVEISASCEFTLKLYGCFIKNVRGKEASKRVLLHASKNINIKAVYTGFTHLEITTQPKASFGLKVVQNVRQIEEPHDPTIEAPIFEYPDVGENLILQLQQRAQKEAKLIQANKPGVNEPMEGEERPNPYLLHDTHPDIFEEDQDDYLLSLAETVGETPPPSVQSPDTAQTAPEAPPVADSTPSDTNPPEAV